MALAAVFAALATALWAALSHTQALGSLATVFFLTVSACWAVLLPAKFWTKKMDDSWGRRLLMLMLGLVVGLQALWLDGWTPYGGAGVPDARGPATPPALANNVDMGEVTAYLGYFGLIFVALRWWKTTERRRGQRFSFAPILATGFWALILLLLWPQLKQGAVALVMASAIVQLVSPWEQPPPPQARRLRLRYA